MPANSRWDLIRRLRVNKWLDSLDVSEKKYLAHTGNRTPKAPSPKKSAESNVIAEWLPTRLQNVIAEWLPTRLQNFLSSFLPNSTKSH